MVDLELARLMQETADRSVAAIDRLRDELLADRTRDDQRFARLEGRLDALVGDLATLGELYAELDRRCGALVVEEELPDGSTVARARPATLGLDLRTILGALLTLFTTGALPVLVVHYLA